MAQESYADYSIIHKYFQQEKLHEEELQRFKDQMKDLTNKLATAQRTEKEAADRARQLNERVQELEQMLKDKENDIGRLNSTVNNLNQKIAAMTRGR
jgi:chromosome segregation ATPase